MLASPPVSVKRSVRTAVTPRASSECISSKRSNSKAKFDPLFIHHHHHHHHIHSLCFCFCFFFSIGSASLSHTTTSRGRCLKK